jgi:hypothetical protein
MKGRAPASRRLIGERKKKRKLTATLKILKHLTLPNSEKEDVCRPARHSN